MGLKHCPKCEIIASPDKNFCFLCGSKLVERPEDPKCKCGCEMMDGFDFCPNCGLPREEALSGDAADALDNLDLAEKDREEIKKNNTRLDIILKNWGYSISIRDNEAPVPIEKVRQLVEELEAFIATLPPPSQKR